MKKPGYIGVLSFLLLLLNGFSYAQQTEIDSLENLLKTSTNDTAKLKLLNAIGREYYYQEDYPKALVYLSKGLELGEELDDQEAIAKTLKRVGRIYYSQGDYATAMQNYIRALDIYEDLNIENSEKGYLLHFIGSVFKRQHNYEKACEFYQKELDVANRLKDDYVKAEALYLLSSCADRLEDDNEKALALDLESLRLYEKLDDITMIALQSINVAADHEYLGDYNKALEFYLLGLHYHKELRDTSMIASDYCDIGDLYGKKKEYSRAFYYLKQAEAFLPYVKGKRHLRYQAYYKYSYRAYKGTGDYKNALKFHLLYSSLKDSILYSESMRQVAEMETIYATEKAERENEIFRQEKELRLLREKETQQAMNVKEEQESRRNNLQYSGILLVIVSLFVGTFIIGRFSIPIKLIEGITFLSFLLFFEFTLVLLDPYIEQYSSGAPALKLGFNALLAGMIFPLHQFFETRLHQRIINAKGKKGQDLADQ